MYVGLTEELFWNIMEAGRKVGEEKVEQRNKKECVKRIVEEKSSLSNSWKDQFDEYYEDYLDALRTKKLYESFREQGGEEDELFEGVIRGIVARGKITIGNYRKTYILIPYFNLIQSVSLLLQKN